MLKLSAIAVLMVCAVACLGFGAGASEPAAVGAPLPAISATDESGAVVSLNTFKDKLGVIVFFFPRAFTGG